MLKARYKLAVACLVITFHIIQSSTINIVAIVDEKQRSVRTNLQNAVQYMNDPSTGILLGHNISLHTVKSSDNDSYAVMKEVCSRLPVGVDVILDISSRFVTATVRSLADAIGITHVSAVDPAFEAAGRSFDTSINIRPPESTMLQSIRDIVSQENITNVGIIYDETFDLDDKPKLLLRNIPAQHLYLRMATGVKNIKKQLAKFREAELSHIFLACKSSKAKVYLEHVHKEGMMNFKYNWYVMTKDPNVTCTGCTKKTTVVTLTGNYNLTGHDKYIAYVKKLGQDPTEIGRAFVYDMVNIVSKSVAQLIDANQWPRIKYVDCYAFNATDPAAHARAVRLKNELQKTNHSTLFGPIIFHSNYAIQDIVLMIKRLILENSVLKSDATIGEWSLERKLVSFGGSITDKNVKKMYRVVTVVQPPFVFKTNKTDPRLADTDVYYNSTTGFYYYGYCIELLYKINKSLNFDFILYESPDNAFGSMQTDGSWNGMIHELKSEKADIAVSSLSVMAERESVIDFTVPYYDLVGITILMKKPKFEYSLFKFMSVLEEAVWGCVFSAFIIVSILLCIFDKYSPYSYQNNKDTWDGQGEEPRIFSLKEGFWFCMTSLTPQGGGEAPRALSGRLVAATWWMFGFIMIATYTANLAAFLTVSRLDQPIQSLDDLAKQFKTKYAPQASTATQVYFKRMADIEDRFYSIWKAMSLNDSLDQVERAKLAVWDYPVSDKFTNMWVSMAQSKFPATFKEATNRIKNKPNGEEFAFIGDATINKYATLTDCELWEVGEEFSRKPYALAVQEGSSLKTELSSVILQLLNQRVLEDLKTKWWDWSKVKCDKIEDESDGISIRNIGGVFLVIFIGIGLGLITLAFEYYWYKWRPNHMKPKPTQNGLDACTQNNAVIATG